MDELRLRFEQRVHPDGVVNSIEVAESDSFGRLGVRTVVDFQHIGRSDLPEPIALDGYMFAFLLPAMASSRRLIIEGPLSSSALRNANLLAEAWRNWLPDQYRPIEISPESIIDEQQNRREGPSSAIAAFSGGVDATFTLLRHTNGTLGSASFPISDVVMVHGFDVRRDRVSDFTDLVERTRPLVEQIGVQLNIVRTNIRQVSDYDWEHAFGTRLACVLHQFSSQHQFGLMASASPYSHPVIPWGSTPSTDHLLSGDGFSVVHDGAGFSRSEKVAEIAKNAVTAATIKVCWQGTEHQGRNCGECEKCVRTRLNFLAVGVDNPPCFETPFDISMIDHIQPINEVQVDELRSIIAYASSNSVEAEWVGRLTDKLREIDGPGTGSAQLRTATSPKVVEVSEQFRERLRQHGEAMCQFIRGLGPIRLLAGIPGNLGDHLIWQGTRRLLARHGVQYEEVDLSELVTLNWPSQIGTLVIPGSGALTAHFNEWLPEAVITASRLFRRVVILPSEFEPEVPAVQAALSRENVFAFARDSHSYEKTKHFGRATLAPDPALWSHGFVPGPPAGTADVMEGEILLAVRTDSLSRLPGFGLRPALSNRDISAIAADLNEFLNYVRQSDCVVTDRLHVAVAAIILGKTLHYLDPANEKITRYLSYTFRGEMAERIHRHDTDWLIEQGFVSRTGADR